MTRTRRAPLCTEAEITCDAIAELQAQMAAITTTHQALNVQSPLPPVRDNVERNNKDRDDDDDDEVADNENPFALSVITVPLHVIMTKE